MFATYLVAAGAMLLSGTSALILIAALKSLDPPPSPTSARAPEHSREAVGV